MVDPIPAWIRIQANPFLAPLYAFPAPVPDPQKSGIVTPLGETPLYILAGYSNLLIWAGNSI